KAQNEHMFYRFAPGNRTSDLHVNEYGLPLDRVRETPSRSGPAARRDARRGSSRLGRASAEFPRPACCQTNARSRGRAYRKIRDRPAKGRGWPRRRGFPRVRLPCLPWSPSFMAAYEAALAGPRTAIGAGRIKPGSAAAAVAEYLDSQAFFGSKSAGTQRMRRGILQRLRAAYCGPPVPPFPAEGDQPAPAHN